MKSTHKGHLRSQNPTLGMFTQTINAAHRERDAVGRRKEKHQDVRASGKKDKKLLSWREQGADLLCWVKINPL
jgi:hypothetical protein